VKIDFGDVSMNMRNLLRKMGKKSFRPGKAAAMMFLNAPTRRPSRPCARHGGRGLQGAALCARPAAGKLAARKQTSAPPATLGTAPLKSR
jgi:hypothetical protein